MAEGFGTWISYQGYPGRAVVFRRERGIKGTFSYVDIYGQDLSLKSGTPTSINPTPTPTDFKAGVTLENQIRPKLDLYGDLVLAEDTDDPKNPTVVRIPLFVDRIETIEQSDATGATAWRVFLVDERYFWTRGALDKWIFNKKVSNLEGGGYIESTLNAGKPFKLSEILRKIGYSIFRTHRISEMPTDFDSVIAYDFAPFANAASTLNQICIDQGITEPCFKMDGTIGLHKVGHGKVAQVQTSAQGVPSGENTVEIPDKFKLYKDGVGIKQVSQYGNPSDYVVVVGGPKIVTISVDNWTPVIDTGVNIRPLTENLIRRFTRGRYGMDWLRKWILAPDQYQNVLGLDPAVVNMLREQAFKLYELPDTFIHQDPAFKPQDKSKILSGRQEDAPTNLDPEQVIEFERLYKDAANERVLVGPDGKIVAEAIVPGPNYRLLPLLPDPNTKGIIAEIYAFDTVHKTRQTTQEEEDIRTSRRTQSLLKDQITAQAEVKGVASPWAYTDPLFVLLRKSGEPLDPPKEGERFNVIHAPLPLVWFTGDLEAPKKKDDPATAGELWANGKLLEKSFNSLRVRGALALLARDADDKLGEQYDHAIKEELRLSDTLTGGVDADMYDVAKETIQIQAELAALSRGILKSATVHNQVVRAADLRWEAIQGKLKVIREKYAAAQQKLNKDKGIGLRTGQRLTYTRHQNLYVDFEVQTPIRCQDPRARIYDAKRGLVLLSRLPGHVADPSKSLPIDTEFLPGPVRVTFGVKVKPFGFTPKVDPGRLKQATFTGDNADLLRRIDELFSKDTSLVRISRTNLELAALQFAALKPKIANVNSGLRLFEEFLTQGATNADLRILFLALKDNANVGLTSDDLERIVAPLMPARANDLKDAEGLTDIETTWSKAWQRSGDTPIEVKIGEFPLHLAMIIHRGELNGENIKSQGYLYAFAHLTRQEIIDSETFVFGRPRAVNCDGLVAAVEIRSRTEGGFETVVTTGANYRKLIARDGNVTRSIRNQIQAIVDEVKP